MFTLLLTLSYTLQAPLLFGSFGWGEILIIALVIVIPIIIIGSRLSSRRLRSYMDTQKQTGVADELAKLANLRDRGIITDEEFEAQKRKLLK